MKKIRSSLLLSLLSPLILVLIYLLFGWSASKIVIGAEIENREGVVLYLISNGKHTDIALPVKNGTKDWSELFPYSLLRTKDTLFTHIAFGWGDQGFFLDMPTWDDLTFKLAFNALFWLNKTAMHVTYHKEPTVGELCRKLEIGEQQYLQLVEFIEKKFKRGPEGSFIKIETDAHYGTNDTFWEANGRYSLLYSCNSWTNSALKTIGEKHLLWTFFDKPLLRLFKPL
ncbi:MAG: TIGR02117 family protein [Bacteroidales bacterium]